MGRQREKSPCSFVSQERGPWASAGGARAGGQQLLYLLAAYTVDRQVSSGCSSIEKA